MEKKDGWKEGRKKGRKIYRKKERMFNQVKFTNKVAGAGVGFVGPIA